MAALRRLLEELERPQVDNARKQHWSWQDIASALQVSRQSVQEKLVGRNDMFERFNETAKHAVTSAQQEAMEFGHDYIGTAHLLPGIVETEDIAAEVLREHGVAGPLLRTETARALKAEGYPATGGNADTEALAAIGIDIAEIRHSMDESFGVGTFKFPRPLFSPRAKRVLELTLPQAIELKANHIGTKHLLLAGGDGHGISALEALEVDIPALRPAVLARLSE